MSGQIRVTVWNEYVQERESPEIHDIYPEGIHGCLRGFLEKERDITVTCVTLDMPRQGITRELLDETDVLIWWSHAKQDDIALKIDTALFTIEKTNPALKGLIVALLKLDGISKVKTSKRSKGIDEAIDDFQNGRTTKCRDFEDYLKKINA